MKQHPKLHNAMWPGLVGKGDGPGQEPPISLSRMLELTAAANVDGQRFEGIDYFLFFPHTDPNASDDDLRKIADQIASYGFSVGSLVAPVWPGTVGDSAMGDDAAREKFLSAVTMACRIANVFEAHGVRKYGVIRIDSAEFGVDKWRSDPKANTARIVETFKLAAKIAKDHGQRLAAEGEICWAGMHSWRDMLDVLEGVGMPEALGFQADLAHTYLYLLGYNAPEYAMLGSTYSQEEFYDAYRKMTDKLRPWTITSTERARTTRRASIVRPTIQMANSISSSVRAIGCKTLPLEVSNTSAGMGACSPMPPSKTRAHGTRSCRP
jgi:sugar phosphate isomerase/epimerase